MSNRSSKILWSIDYSSMTSITHWCNELLIDDPSTVVLRTKETFLASCTIFFPLWFFLSVLGAFFHVSEVPVDDVEMQSANHEYKWFSIVQFTKLNNLDGATVKVWSNKNDNWKILENLSSIENGLPLSQ